MRREWEVKVRLEIDWLVGLEIERFKKEFEREVEVRVEVKVEVCFEVEF